MSAAWLQRMRSEYKVDRTTVEMNGGDVVKMASPCKLLPEYDSDEETAPISFSSLGSSCSDISLSPARPSESKPKATRSSSWWNLLEDEGAQSNASSIKIKEKSKGEPIGSSSSHNPQSATGLSISDVPLSPARPSKSKSKSKVTRSSWPAAVPSKSKSKSKRFSWWDLEELESPKSAFSIDIKKSTEKPMVLPPGWRNPLENEDEAHNSKVDARVALANMDKSLGKKKKKTKSDKKKKSKGDKKKKTKKDKKKTKKSEKKQKRVHETIVLLGEDLNDSSQFWEMEGQFWTEFLEKQKKKRKTSSSAEPETEPLPMTPLSFEEAEDESQTLEVDAAQSLMVNARKLQTLVALEKDFEDKTSTIIRRNSIIGDDASWW